VFARGQSSNLPASFDPQADASGRGGPPSRSMPQGACPARAGNLCSVMMRLLFDGVIGRTASLGSPGVSEVRWLAPLRPGDDLTLDVDVVETRVSKSRPDTGIVTFKGTARNAAGQVLWRDDVADHRQAREEQVR